MTMCNTDDDDGCQCQWTEMAGVLGTLVLLLIFLISTDYLFWIRHDKGAEEGTLLICIVSLILSVHRLF